MRVEVDTCDIQDRACAVTGGVTREEHSRTLHTARI